MAVKFVPTGFLDINTDPSRLPSEASGKNEVSGAMTRCTNLHLDNPGTATTRPGSSKINSSAMGQTTPHFLIEMGGNRVAFSGTEAYWDENAVGNNLTSARWSGIKYNAYNVTAQSIFALNGTDRKRIEGSPQVTQAYDYAYMHSWEADHVSGTVYQFGIESGSYRAFFSWEPSSSSDDTIVPWRTVWVFEAVQLWEWGIDAPSTAPTLSNGVSGYAYAHDWEGTEHATTGSYQFGTTRNDYQCLYDWEQAEPVADSVSYRTFWFFEDMTGYASDSRIGVKYTYCRKSGTTLECESNPSSAAYIESDSGFQITWAEPSDFQVTHVRVYRTLAGGATFYYAGEYDASDLTAIVTTVDSALGSTVETDHDRPPTGAVVAGPTYNGYCFILKDNLLYFCKPNRPEYWPATYYIEVSPPQEPLKGIDFYNGVPYVMSEREVYMIQGTGYDSFFPFPMRTMTGALDHIGVLSITGQGIGHIDTEGLYMFAGNTDKKISEEKFGPLFDGTTKGSIPGMNRSNAANCWLLLFDNKLWFGYPGGTATYPDNVIVVNLLTNRPVHYSYSSEFGAVAIDYTNDRILALDSSGYVWKLDDSSVTTDDGTDISWQIESKSYTDQLYKYFPRSAKYDVELGSGATATGTILLNETSVQTHTLSTSRKTKRRLITGGNGDRLGMRVNGTGSVDIREVEVI